MSKKALYLLGILLLILLGTYFYWKYCCDAECCGKSTETEVTQSETEEVDTTTNEVTTTSETSETETNSYSFGTAGMPFALKDANGDFNFNASENFNFNPNGYAINLPVSEEMNGGIDNMIAYFDANKGKRLNITGFYTSTEENNSAYPNLGMARANSVKNYMKDRGMKSRFMNIFGQLEDGLSVDGTSYKGPVSYDIITKDTGNDDEAEEMKALLAKIQANPLVLYFPSGANTINLTAAQRQKVADISKYLDKVEGASASVVGHTDNTGSRATNTSLGLKRANFAKNYLVTNGIPGSKVTTDSKGPDEPIASNDTDEGKAKNRRVVVTIN